MKNNSETKLIQKLVSIHPVKHVQIIRHFIEDGRATSESDVMRQALVFYHDKIYPNYVHHLSPAGKLKAKTLKKIEDFEAMPPEEFVFKQLKGVVGKVNGEPKFGLFQGLGHVPLIIPLENIKEWAETHKADVNYHLQELRSLPNEEFFSYQSVLVDLVPHNIEVCYS